MTRLFDARFCRGAGAMTLGLVLAASPIAALAQGKPSLAELARQEEARRKAIKVPGIVYSDKDVKQAPPPAPAAPGGTAASGSAPTPVAEAAGPQKAEGPVKDQAFWKARMDQAREDLRRSEVFAEALQTRVNALTNDYAARDDPYQRAKVGEDRQKALAELQRVRADVENFKKQITDIEEDARRAAVPPGWLR